MTKADQRDGLDRSLLALRNLVPARLDKRAIEMAHGVRHDTGGGMALILVVANPYR